MAERTPLFMDIDDVYSGDELGLPYRDFVSEGVVGVSALAVTQNGGGDLSVNVAAGAAWVVGDTDTAFQPTYRVANDATVNLGITPDPSNPRKVLVVAQVTDEAFALTGREWELVAIHGTPAGSPVEPALPASALPLALIDVTAADVSIATAQITDRRFRAGFGDEALLWSSVLTADTTSIDIPGIPQGFESLRLVVVARSDQAGSQAVYARLNGDTAANYDNQYVQGGGAAPAAGETFATSSGMYVCGIPGSTGAVGSGVTEFPGYAGTTFHKSSVERGGYKTGTSTGNLATQQVVSYWRSAAAVNRLTIAAGVGKLQAGSRIALYGIKG